MSIGSLFAGIGGLELGLERAGFGPVRWQVEIDPFRRAVLERHWPHAQRYSDVRRVGGDLLTSVDLICGGFPCRDVSSAGKRAGLAGPQSSLWNEFARIVAEMRPRLVVVENVSSGAKFWVDAVQGDLEQLGYATLPVPIAASDCGALQQRRRVFVVAHAHRQGELAGPLHAEMAGPSAASPDSDGTRLRLEPGRGGRAAGRHSQEPSWAGGGIPEPPMVRVVHGLPRGLDTARWRALGDSVVPQQSEVIGHVLRALLQRAASSSSICET
jgi:DNA (cytosine-5)-methyltransferase 1